MSPLYDYFCDDCEITVEKLLSIRESDEAQFCECGCQLRREVEAPAKMVRGKGSWSSPA